MKKKTTIIMRSMNDSPQLVRQTLESLRNQQGVSFELIHIDSGSTDGSLDVIRELGGRLYHIRPNEYIPGQVLNMGMSLCESDVVVFLNADATPVGRDWLANLIAPFKSDPDLIATFSRQIARPDATPLVQMDYERAFGPEGGHRSWGHFFSMAGSAIRREYWQKRPFDGAIQYSEDIDWTYRARLENKKVLYVPSSIVVHSHNYTLSQSYKRHIGEGEADSWIYSLSPLSSSFLRRVALPMITTTARDISYAITESNTQAALQSLPLRFAEKLGHWRGVHRGGKSAPLPDRRVAPDLSQPTEGLYTIEHNPEFEARLTADFDQIRSKLLQLYPAPVGIVLGGGYGRREGGIVQTPNGPVPYNDYDLYAVFDFPTQKLPRKLVEEVRQLGEELSEQMGIDVDIAPVSTTKLKNAPPRIEWYELRRGHRMLHGPDRFLAMMPDRQERDIPYDEGERLLMNRAIGLLLAQQVLDKAEDSLSEEDVSFVTRNIHKAMLAAGDIVLLRLRLYHYSYRERLQRLMQLERLTPAPFEQIRQAYQKASEFRLHPTFPLTQKEELQAFWNSSKELFEQAHRWFIQVATGAKSWSEYTVQRLEHPSFTVKAPLNAYKTLRFSGRLPASTDKARSYVAHPQTRVRVAAPMLLYAPSHDILSPALLSDALFLPAPEQWESGSTNDFRQTATRRLLELWREVN